MSNQFNPGPMQTGPVNPMPPVVVGLFLVMLGIEAALSLGNMGYIGGPGAVGWRAGAVQTYGINGAIVDWMLAQGVFPAEHMMRFVTYLFVHGSFTHMIVAGVLLLALGKFVGDVFAWWAVLGVFFGSGIGGAVVWALVLGDPGYIFGAFPGVYGLIGAFSFILWLRLGQAGENRARAFVLIGFLIGIQLIFGLLFGARSDWVADLGGFACGFLLSFVVSPGGWQSLRARLRHR
ncbi:rhomboid family intramembrane serine protease [Aquicoccus porphyridii]|nr:rhomboid family intramembrane serine protease [Aquicoccus porphyridii]